MQTIRLAYIRMATICVLSLILISCQNSPTTQANTTQTVKYECCVGIERLAKHITPDEEEQKRVINFLSNFKDTFHISLQGLFQESDYLVVALRETQYDERLHFYFTNQEPKDRDGLLYFNGYLSYSHTHMGKYSWFESWYEGPSKFSDWSSGKGFSNDDLFKIIDLNNRKVFDWYQEP